MVNRLFLVHRFCCCWLPATAVKVELESIGMESYTTFSVQRELLPVVTTIVEDSYKEGNVLVGVGSAVYTVDSSGDHELIAGRLGNTDNRPQADKLGIDGMYWNSMDWMGSYDNVGSTVLNLTHGLAQLPDGKLIISDFNHGCLRVVDRGSGLPVISTLAGQCEVRSSKFCTFEDGLFNEAKFCYPTRLIYVEEGNIVMVLDESKNGSFIRVLNMTTQETATLSFGSQSIVGRDMFYRKMTESIDVLVATNYSLLRLIYEFNEVNPKVVCLIGDDVDCETKRPQVMGNEMFHSMAVDGDLVALVDRSPDMESNVYLYDLKNNRLSNLCDYIDLFCPYRAASVAFIGGYLYVGESIRYTTGDITITRIEYRISEGMCFIDNWSSTVGLCVRNFSYMYSPLCKHNPAP